jgi:FAD/FMN-containing dehydrogenase
MNRIRKIDPDDFSAVVDAGCILSELKDKLASDGIFFPLALGAQGSCHIGGNVSTNAGGVNVLRYGIEPESWYLGWRSSCRAVRYSTVFRR